jgi:hypothetical protein
VVLGSTSVVKDKNETKDNSTALKEIEKKTRSKILIEKENLVEVASNSFNGKYRLDHEMEKYRLKLNGTKILDKLKIIKFTLKNEQILSKRKFVLFLFFSFNK